MDGARRSLRSIFKKENGHEMGKIKKGREGWSAYASHRQKGDGQKGDKQKGETKSFGWAPNEAQAQTPLIVIGFDHWSIHLTDLTISCYNVSRIVGQGFERCGRKWISL